MKPHLSKLLSYLTLFLLIGHAFSVESKIPCGTTLEGDSETQTCPSLHECINGYCVHKDIFPMTGVEIVGSIVLMVLAGLANSGGLGGGALLSPILLLVFNYSANKSIMIVYGIVFGGSLGNFINFAFQKNPKTNRPYVDYDLSLITMPQMILGAMIGVLINRVLAPILIILGLIGITIYTGRKVFEKAKTQYAAETKIKESPGINDLNKGMIPREERELLEFGGSGADTFNNSDPALKAILEEDQELFPIEKIKLILLMIGFAVLTVILRGSKEFQSPIGLEYCNVGYWFIFVVTIAGYAALYFKNTAFLRRRLEVKRVNNYKPQPEEFTVTEHIMQRMGILSLIAGISAGLLGLGGGMVMGPVLLQLGINPQSYAATVGFFVVQTSFITLFQSFFYGDVSPTELFFFVGISFIGSFGVSWVLNYMVKKYKRPSIILIALTFVLGLSFIVMPLFGIYKSIDQPAQMFTFHSVC